MATELVVSKKPLFNSVDNFSYKGSKMYDPHKQHIKIDTQIVKRDYKDRELELGKKENKYNLSANIASGILFKK